MAAILRAASLRPGQARHLLSQVFASEEDMLVRSRAVATATRLDVRARLPLLKRQAARDEEPELRMQAINALAASQETQVAAMLGHIVWRDFEPEVRLTAVQALRRIGGDRARTYLEKAVDHWDAELGGAAEQALASWPD